MTEPPQHYNPLLVTVLPKERRSRHSYQLAAMMTLLTLGAWQLIFGTLPMSSMGVLDHRTFVFMNWVCILAGTAGLAAAIIPERIVDIRICLLRKLFRTKVDATYFRLWEEFGAHLILLAVWVAYGQVVWAGYGIIKGYTIGLAAAIWFGVAALIRAIQIWFTLYQAGTFNRAASAIVSQETLTDDDPT